MSQIDFTAKPYSDFLKGTIMHKLKKVTAQLLLASGASMILAAPTVHAEDSLYSALSEGKVSFSARVRYEGVEQKNALKDADALTVRTTLGYATGDLNGFSGFVEFEDVSDIGSAKYNSLTNNETQYSVVADPEGTEVNQAYLQYKNSGNEFKLGRQEITYRGAPFHRFVGNVLWRQNHQSYDALSYVNTSFKDTKLSYAYINKVHTIFGEDRSAGLIENGVIHMDSHLINLQYTGLGVGKLEAYSYLLDYEDAAVNNANSTATYGLRLNGGQMLTPEFKAIYTLEYATQDDYADGDMARQDYQLYELGGKYKGWLAKVSYELQEGDGTYSFKTPLGTNHAFQGWADQFLNTPSQGLQDLSFTVVGQVLGAKLVAAYHDFETDKDSLDAGSEIDVLLHKPFMKHYAVGVKYSDYKADSDFSSLVDTKKLWVYGSVKF
jgi:hypothetical protein